MFDLFNYLLFFSEVNVQRTAATIVRVRRLDGRRAQTDVNCTTWIVNMHCIQRIKSPALVTCFIIAFKNTYLFVYVDIFTMQCILFYLQQYYIFLFVPTSIPIAILFISIVFLVLYYSTIPLLYLYIIIINHVKDICFYFCNQVPT